MVDVDELLGAPLSTLGIGPFEIVDSADALRLVTTEATLFGAVVQLLALLSHDEAGLHHRLLHLLLLSGFAQLVPTLNLSLFLLIGSDQFLVATKSTDISN